MSRATAVATVELSAKAKPVGFCWWHPVFAKIDSGVGARATEVNAFDLCDLPQRVVMGELQRKLKTGDKIKPAIVLNSLSQGRSQGNPFK